MRFYRSSDSTITSADTQVGTDTVDSIGSGFLSSEGITLTAPSDAGTYYYGACVDAVTDESDTTNNCSSGVQVTVSDRTSLAMEVEGGSAMDSGPMSPFSITGL